MRLWKRRRLSLIKRRGARAAISLAYLGLITSECGGLCTVKFFNDDGKIETQRIRAQREARDFDNILSSSTLPLETLEIDVCCLQDATWRCGRGESGGDIGNKVQIRIQNSLLTSLGRMEMGVRGLSLTAK